MSSSVSSDTVSIIVPVHNGAATIGRCLDSLFNQDCPVLEIIVVDDGSTDGTPDLVKSPATLVRSGGQKGAGAARNAGARAARGDVLMFTDADVAVPRNWVRRALETMQAHGVDCGGGGYAGPLKEVFMQQFAFEELAFRRRHIGGYVATLVSNNLLCRAALFREAGGFPEHYRAASSEDMEFSWKVSRTHKLWWDRDNGVYHDFAGTLSRYLKQQFGFARDAVPMLLKTSGLMKGKTHHGRLIYVETFLTLAAVMSGLVGYAGAMGLMFGGVLLVNLPFLVFIAAKRGPVFILKSVPTIVARNLAIVAGCGWGFFRMVTGKGRNKS
ncbi:MAG: glycosyltransferase [Kiritimatiellae bacterium]|nr:glycosyltransferase [Kiritimatiellia bacterium]